MKKDIFEIFKNPKPIYIKWSDHFSHRDGWSLTDSFKNTSEYIANETIGWLCAESKLSYAISLSYCKEMKNSSDSITILKACILKKKIIKGL